MGVGLAATRPVAATEDELFEAACRGDLDAVAALYRRHRAAALAVARRCTASSADAEDAVSEAFARLFTALPRLAGRPIAFRPYLLASVRNAAFDRHRRAARVALEPAVADGPAPGPDPEEQALRRAQHDLVVEALLALPGRWRTVLWLTEVEGLSPFEVSARLGIKPNAVSALAYRSRAGLRRAYEEAAGGQAA